MKVKLYFNTQRKGKNGEIPISLYVYLPPKRFYINTGMTTKKPFEDCVFPRSESNHRAKTARINQILDDTEALLYKNMSADVETIMELIRTKVLSMPPKEKPKTLCDCIVEYANKARAPRTKEIYLATENKVRQFNENTKLNVDEIWVEDFETLMLKTMCANSCAIHLRNLRAVFNYARKRKYTTNYPFKNFKITTEETAKRNLSIEQIKHIRDMEVKPHEERYRDMFMLMFYLIGVNAVDLFTAKKNQLVNGRLEYRRAKTHKLYSIKVEDEAMEILKKYEGKDYLLNISDTSYYKHFLKHLNDFLDGVYEGTTSYYARHSWASIAYDLDVSMETISQGLGHSFGSKVTNIYIDKDPKKVDIAHRKVLDALK